MANGFKRFSDEHQLLDAVDIPRNDPRKWKRLAILLAKWGGLIEDAAPRTHKGPRPRGVHKRSLARKFRRFRRQHPNLKSDNAAARLFVKTQRTTYSTSRSLLKAVREGEKLLIWRNPLQRPAKRLVTDSEYRLLAYRVRRAMGLPSLLGLPMTLGDLAAAKKTGHRTSS